MKGIIIYSSKTGNTKTMAEYIYNCCKDLCQLDLKSIDLYNYSKGGQEASRGVIISYGSDTFQEDFEFLASPVKGQIEFQGPPDQVISSQAMSKIYYTDLEIKSLEGRLVVLPKEENINERNYTL